MSSQSDRLRAQAERIRNIQQAPEQPKLRAPRALSRPVRRTVDLSPEHHAQLAAWCTETAQELGVARITGQDVLSLLVARLLEDENLAEQIKDDLFELINQR